MDDIKSYIGIKSTELFNKFIKSGMPAKVINGRWYAHTENIDRYFRAITNVKNKTIPKKAE